MRTFAQWDLTEQRPPVEGVPDAVVASCARIGHDLLAAPAAFPLPVAQLRWWAGEYDDEEAPPDVLLVGLTAEQGMRFGSGVAPDAEPSAELTAALADGVQDHLAGYEFVQWPACPGHQHLLRAGVVGEDACWSCPDSGRPVAVIGALAPTRG
ncbi:hypothetical protein [Kitasatospora viridis]|uniref:Uncharacterized protein n=1 Tax=Kitasatospora viridis TaxID=281105 RepID=A0A561SE89_9ACTN|nr:hypothetical protein [Kitasatospora viridis]TWF73184.1 hypothetical protein FHX73_16335 [Kitasatospora viridis]